MKRKINIKIHKISTQQLLRTKSVSPGDKSMCNFTKRKINIEQVSRTKISIQQVPRGTSYTKKKSARNKLHKQNQFHKEKK